MFMKRDKAEKLVDELIEEARKHKSFGVSRLDVLRRVVIDELAEPNWIDTANLFPDDKEENEDH